MRAPAPSAVAPYAEINSTSTPMTSASSLHSSTAATTAWACSSACRVSFERTAAPIVATIAESRSSISATLALNRLRSRSTTDFTIVRFSFNVREGNRRRMRTTAMVTRGSYGWSAGLALAVSRGGRPEFAEGVLAAALQWPGWAAPGVLNARMLVLSIRPCEV